MPDVLYVVLYIRTHFTKKHEMRSAQKRRWQGVRRVACHGTRKEHNAASAFFEQNPQGAACLGGLLCYESGARRPVLPLIRALHSIPNRTRSHSCFFMKRVLKDQTSPLSPDEVMPFIASRIRACLNVLRLYVFRAYFSCRKAMKFSQEKSSAASSAALMTNLIAKDDGVCAPMISSAFPEPLLLVLHLSKDARGKANALCACNYTVFA